MDAPQFDETQRAQAIALLRISRGAISSRSSMASKPALALALEATGHAIQLWEDEAAGEERFGDEFELSAEQVDSLDAGVAPRVHRSAALHGRAGVRRLPGGNPGTQFGRSGDVSRLLVRQRLDRATAARAERDSVGRLSDDGAESAGRGESMKRGHPPPPSPPSRAHGGTSSSRLRPEPAASVGSAHDSLRLIVPVQLVEAVLRLLRGLDAVTNIVHLPGAGIEPVGDVVLCDVAREDVSLVVEQLIALGLDREGSIALEAVDASVSAAARAAMQRAPGSAADAVLWEQVEQTVRESTDLSAAYVLFMAIATMIAAVGILTDSAVLIVGAMVVGPEFGPLAALCLAIVRRRPRVARASIVALVVGFAIAIARRVDADGDVLRASISPLRRRSSRIARRRSSSRTPTRTPCSWRFSPGSPGCCHSRRRSRAR